MKTEIKTTLFIAAVLLSFALGFSIRSEYIFNLGKEQGRADFIKLITDLGMEGKTFYFGVPIATNKWMNVKYEVITSGLTPQQSSNLYNAVKELQANAKTNKIPEAKEAKP